MTQPTGTQSGAAGGDPNAQSGTVDPQTGQPTTTEPNTDPNAQSATGTTGQPTDSVTRAEFEQVMARMQAADRRASAAETKLQAAEREKLSETERTKAELADAQAALEAGKVIIQKQSLELAFLKDNTYKWRDADAALKLADLSAVEYKDDGTVNGLKDALKKLAESRKYLLEDEAPTTEPPTARRTPAMNSGGQPNPPDRNALESKFPALRGRVKSN